MPERDTMCKIFLKKSFYKNPLVNIINYQETMAKNIGTIEKTDKIGCEIYEDMLFNGRISKRESIL